MQYTESWSLALSMICSKVCRVFHSCLLDKNGCNKYHILRMHMETTEPLKNSTYPSLTYSCLYNISRVLKAHTLYIVSVNTCNFVCLSQVKGNTLESLSTIPWNFWFAMIIYNIFMIKNTHLLIHFARQVNLHWIYNVRLPYIQDHYNFKTAS